eukprot:gene4201-5974_t
MQIFVRSVQNTFVVNLEEGATLKDLKEAIEDVEFVPTQLQNIVKGSTSLTEGCLDNVLQDSETVTLLMAVDGGMRAKWRKKRMRRLRRKRRKMRMRAK